MKTNPITLWRSIIFSVVLLLVATLISAQEVEDEREFGYVTGSETGPERWGEIKKEWALCKTGKLQSPIDLFHRRVMNLPKSEEIKKFYRPGKAVLKNRGHDIELEWKDENSKIQINGTNYILRQAHWHSPSEHTINGKRFDLELHLVHQSKDSKIAVIGLLYKIGKPDPFLYKLRGKLKSISDNETEINIGMINPDSIKITGIKYYRYIGSLTTPPCTEGVLWTVKKEIRNASVEQLKLLRDAVHDHAENNARPLQPLNKRKVKLYTNKNKRSPR